MIPELHPTSAVVQPNFITEAQFTLSEIQLDIFVFVLAQMTSDDPPGMVYNVFYEHIEKIADRQIKRKNARIKAFEMIGKKLRFKNPRTGRMVYAPMFASVEPFEGGIQVELSAKLQEHLSFIKKRFTSYQLYAALSMSSKYAKRIYMLCSQWRENEATRVYDIDELREMLGLEDKLIAWKDFEKRVLEKAIEQINEYSELQVKYKAEKAGRSYKWVQFFVKKGNPHQRTIDFSNTEYSKALERINKMATLREYKLRDDQIETILTHRHWKDVVAVLHKVEARKKEGKVQNLGAYVAKSLEIF
jgi:plasmid replication initiation protein